jgi:hypothetical protein
MPFTLAHVVLARPLWRAVGRQLPLSGIAVGSVAPDLEYLAHLDTERTIGHLLHGVFLLDLPLALVLLALWHGLIKRPLAALVSPRLRPPVDTSPFAFGPADRFGLVVASILTGVAGPIGRPHVYDLFNYASTVAGMVLLGWWWWRAVDARSASPVFAEPAALSAGVRRIALATLIALSAAGGIANGARLRLDGWGIETTVIGAILGAMAAGLVTIVVVSAVLQAGSRRC